MTPPHNRGNALDAELMKTVPSRTADDRHASRCPERNAENVIRKANE